MLMTYRRSLAWFLVLIVVAASGLLAMAPPDRVDEDDDAREFSRHNSQNAIRENCLICHSADLITTAHLTPKQWKTEVEKMVGWGSPLPKDAQGTLIDYLSAEYPAGGVAPKIEFLRHGDAEASVRLDDPKAHPVKGDPTRGQAAYVKNCANCHGNDGQGAELGPNLVEKPVLYRLDDYAKVVRKGRGRMPGFASLVNAEAESDILIWLRSRPYPSTFAPPH